MSEKCAISKRLKPNLRLITGEVVRKEQKKLLKVQQIANDKMYI